MPRAVLLARHGLAKAPAELGPAQLPLPDCPSPCRGPARPRSASLQAAAGRPPPMVCQHGAQATSLVACFSAVVALSFASAPLCSASMALPWSFPVHAVFPSSKPQPCARQIHLSSMVDAFPNSDFASHHSLACVPVGVVEFCLVSSSLASPVLDWLGNGLTVALLCRALFLQHRSSSGSLIRYSR
jgi:hypothetical protein